MVLGGGRFLMSEVPLQPTEWEKLLAAGRFVQGYLGRKKQWTPRTLQ